MNNQEDKKIFTYNKILSLVPSIPDFYMIYMADNYAKIPICRPIATEEEAKIIVDWANSYNGDEYDYL